MCLLQRTRSDVTIWCCSVNWVSLIGRNITIFQHWRWLWYFKIKYWWSWSSSTCFVYFVSVARHTEVTLHRLFGDFHSGSADICLTKMKIILRRTRPLSLTLWTAAGCCSVWVGVGTHGGLTGSPRHWRSRSPDAIFGFSWGSADLRTASGAAAQRPAFYYTAR